MKKLTCLILSTFVFLNAFSQDKAEKEESIKEEEVVAEALSFIQKANFKKRVRWYKEYGLETQSIEAKVKFNRHIYSIEFSMDGQIEDIERKLKFKKLESIIRNKINTGLNEKFDKFRVLKTQTQWFKNTSGVLNYFNHAGDLPIPEGFELVVTGWLKGNIETYEVTSDQAGNITQVLKFVSRPTDNLDF